MPSVFRYAGGMATADHPGDPAPPRRLRRDAQRNRDAILTAARAVFCDHGLEAPLEEIARHAGVGIATLYRRFPSRVELPVLENPRRMAAIAEIEALYLPDIRTPEPSLFPESGRRIP